jgi:hypothetical protein
MNFSSFYKLFLENRELKNFHSWLSPNGEIYPVQHSHGDWAEKFLSSKGIDTNEIKKYESLLNVMFREGWSRITIHHPDVYCHKTGSPPTNYSLRKLINDCEENNIKSIILDNETDYDKTLWFNINFNQ